MVEVLLRLRLRIDCNVDLLDLIGAKGVADQIDSSIRFLGYGVRCDLQGTQRLILYR